jgi:hypothetical protein
VTRVCNRDKGWRLVSVRPMTAVGLPDAVRDGARDSCVPLLSCSVCFAPAPIDALFLPSCASPEHL